MTNNYRREYEKWLAYEELDKESYNELSVLDEGEIEDRFYKNLEFGTGGLRGVMGAGTNRMNIYTVRQATVGLARDIIKRESDKKSRGVVIAYDSRNNSKLFARECAEVLSAYGIKNYLFESLRPTPELSFAVRHLCASAGIVITASHNPKEYNGYKVYGEDGGQLPPDAAKRILSEINAVDIFEKLPTVSDSFTEIIGKEVDEAYYSAVTRESLGVSIPKDLSIIYTPLHGAGNIPVREVLSRIGVKSLKVIEAQEKPNGDFPTVGSPNPENKEAFDLAIEFAKNNPSDVILGTDPDSDRIGVVVPERDGSFTILNGNQTGTLLCEFICRKSAEQNKDMKNCRVVKTIVTTEMARIVAESYGAKCIDVLTGFKYIGDKIKEFEKSKEEYLFGLEESYGYLKGSYARDKDAVVASMLIAELAAECKSRGITLTEKLNELYEKYGYHKEKLLNFTFRGIEGSERIKALMAYFRNEYAPSSLISKKDYSLGIDGLPKSDVMKFFFEDGFIAVRPSGTEPKIKFYVARVAKSTAECDEKIAAFEKEIEKIAN